MQNISIHDSFVMHLMDMLEIPSSDHIAVTGSFVISLYSVYRTLTNVNQTYQQIFAQSSHTFEYLPPTKSVLAEPVKRATNLKPVRTILDCPPRAVKAMPELTCCRCTTSCTGRRSCYKKDLVCTARCGCSGHFYGRSNPPTMPPSNYQHIAVM